MLSPEVQNFRAPESNFVIQKGKLDSGVDSCLNNIENLKYSHLVSVFLPDTLRVPDDLSKALISDCEYYKILDLTLSELVTREFINCFVKKGELNLLSLNTRLDCDNCIAITPEGLLYLLLDKVTYQSLGIEGKVSEFHQNTKNRYVVTINLTLESFKPGKPNHERTKTCLAKLRHFDVILTWRPPKEDICPSSVAKYFADLGYSVKTCTPKYNVHTVYSVKVPVVKFEEFNENDCFDFAEWLGMVALEGDMENGSPDNYTTSYEVPEPSMELGQVKCLQWRGFFPPQKIADLHELLRKYTQDKMWSALYVQGFSDSVISWSNKEHHYFTNGDNAYIIICSKTNYIICKQICSRKKK